MTFPQFILFAWMPVVLAIFALTSARRAVLATVVVSWLFLPVPFEYHAYIFVKGFPDLDKAMVTSVSVMAAVTIFDLQRIGRFKPRWMDLPMLIWCLCPLGSSLSNGLGAYDGVSGIVDHVIIWGVPYFIGRLYFNNPQAIKELAVAIIIGGLIYVPLCLWEVKMSPQLHFELYGYHPAPFRHHKRYDGYRPMVFMSSGLMIGVWLASATITAYWLWISGQLKKYQGSPILIALALLTITTVLCKATLAIVLLVGGGGALLSVRKLKLTAPLILLIAAIFVYLGVRSTNWWSGLVLVDAADTAINESRAQSLEFRLRHEKLLADKALEKPLAGWASNFRVTDDEGEDISVTDSMWIITFGRNGYLGLLSLFVAQLLPSMVFLHKFPAKRWRDPPIAVGAVFSVLLILYVVDNLFNNFPNPVYIMMIGGLTSLIAGVSLVRKTRPQPT